MQNQAFEGEPDHPGPRGTDHPKSLPEQITSPQAKLVYLYLRSVKKAQVKHLKQSLGLQALALYSILETLIDTTLVECHDESYEVVQE